METPASSIPPVPPSATPTPGVAAPSAPIAGNAVPNVKPVKMSNGESSLLKIVIIILLSLLLIGALLLSFYLYTEYRAASTNLDSQIKSAVLDAVKDREDELEAEFAEREKTPNRSFSGPEDYGSLTLEYPKTWSVYVSNDASDGKTFQAYLHPREVPPISDETIIALRIKIEDSTLETVSKRYASALKKGTVSSSATSVGGVDATRYDGQITNKLVGSVVIFRIRDKVVTLETDAEAYRDDFNKILETVTFNQ
ncbi:hypothetical protein IJI72_03305 [Candidatus Saccharibacteria bacterium]|nr:hypothetical protein [Candidatus Saccharibacteria bacterium]